MIGIASTCGRAKRCGTVSASAAAMKTSAVLWLKCRLRNFANNANVAAMALAASTTGPLQPAIAYAFANSTCASHCVEIQGWPRMVKE